MDFDNNSGDSSQLSASDNASDVGLTALPTSKGQQGIPGSSIATSPDVPQITSHIQLDVPLKSITEKAKAATLVLNRYRIEYQNDWDAPSSILRSETLIADFMRKGEAIQLILPAFPFKSSNRSKKVLGPLPDEAEHISLLHLNGLCEAIRDVTGHSTQLVIISDGISYNDLLGVSDNEVWQYGQELRRMSMDLGCNNIQFCRIQELLDPLSSSLGHIEEAEYLANVAAYRNGLAKHLPDDYDVVAQIATDPDVAQTYKGYKKFLETERDSDQPRSRAEKENASIAKSMLRRGKAFSLAIQNAFPHSVRLSIHPSSDLNKVSISLLPQENKPIMTPWHGAAVRRVDGTISLMHAYTVPSISYDLVHVNGRPWCFRERSELFNWDEKLVSFTYLYPTGIMVRPQDPRNTYALCTVDMQKVRFLAEQCSPVVLRGFKDTMNERAFTAKAYDLGDVLSWSSGVIQKVRDEANGDPRSNSVVSNQAMPMHFDGMFKLKTVKDAQTGKETQVSDIPRFQYFVSQSVAAPGGGFTLFASSERFARYLPQAYRMSKLSKIRWTCKSHGFFDHIMDGLDLIVPHPTKGSPCVRWHQPWPMSETNYGWAEISIDNGSQSLVNLVDSLLFDRRVCLFFAWQKGDILVSDNFAMLHTRTPFESKSSREIWRIHVD
ncbi:hypothetical protein HG530_013947 [Fusarium avenaceum]|nr:hypothetical protein HG530_013947 [Fusarium avenaceum]